MSRKFISGNAVGRVPRAIDLARFARPTTAHEFMRRDTSIGSVQEQCWHRSTGLYQNLGQVDANNENLSYPFLR